MPVIVGIYPGQFLLRAFLLQGYPLLLVLLFQSQQLVIQFLPGLHPLFLLCLGGVVISLDGPVIGESRFLEDSGCLFLEPFDLIQVMLFFIFLLLQGFVKGCLCRIASILADVVPAQKHVELSAGAPERAVLFLALAADFVRFLVGFYGFFNIGLSLCLHEQGLDIGIPFLYECVIPIGQGLVSAERVAVFPVQLVDLVLLLLFRADKVSQLAEGVVQLGTGAYGNGMSFFLYLVFLLQGFFQGVDSVFGAEQPFYPVYQFVAVHDQQHDACRQGGLPREQGGEDLFPYRHALLPGFHQIVIFDPRPFYLVRENGQVVGDGEEKHLGPHSQRGHFPGDLLDTHVQAVELLLGGGQFRGGCLCGLCGRIQLF